jgi:uncharacterized protein YhjY with autotransporter beta-barrel domain
MLLGTASAVAALCATPALAQDAPASGSAFAGPYLGVQIGRGKVESIHSDPDYYYNGEKDGTTVDTGITAGVRVGYDFVSGPLLAGVIGEYNFGKLNSIEEAADSSCCDGEYEIGTRVTRYGSLRGKIGLTDGNLAAFVTAGLARSNARQRFIETDTGSPSTFSGKGDRSGSVIGMGVDYAFGRSTLGLDYSEYRFGQRSHEVIYSDGTFSGYSYRTRYNIKSLALTYGYHFGGADAGVAAPAAAAFGGPYIGLHAGLGEMNAQHDDLDYWYDAVDRGLTTDRNGLIGAQAGYDAVFGNLLVGALAEVTFGKLNSFQSAGADSGSLTYAIGARSSNLASVRAKAGFVSGRLAAYGTLGLARSNAKLKFREEDGSDDFFDSKADRSGYVVGLGAAYALAGKSSLGLDYSEYRFGSKRNEVLYSDGEGEDYFFSQKYKVRALNLTFNYGF